MVPTIINIGFRSNVIPSEGEAMLDVRALPDEDMTKFVAELRRVIDDPSIEVIPPKANARPVSPPSRIDTDMFRAFEKVGRRMFDVPTLPNMMTGATDNAQLRGQGRAGLRHRPHRDPGGRPAGRRARRRRAHLRPLADGADRVPLEHPDGSGLGLGRLPP